MDIWIFPGWGSYGHCCCEHSCSCLLGQMCKSFSWVHIPRSENTKSGICTCSFLMVNTRALPSGHAIFSSHRQWRRAPFLLPLQHLDAFSYLLGMKGYLIVALVFISLTTLSCVYSPFVFSVLWTACSCFRPSPIGVFTYTFFLNPKELFSCYGYEFFLGVWAKQISYPSQWLVLTSCFLMF